MFQYDNKFMTHCTRKGDGGMGIGHYPHFANRMTIKMEMEEVCCPLCEASGGNPIHREGFLPDGEMFLLSIHLSQSEANE